MDINSQWVSCYSVFNQLGVPASGIYFAWAGTGVKRGGLFPYVKNEQVYVCPSDPLGGKTKLSYSMNYPAGYIPDPAVQRPAEFAVFINETSTLDDGNFNLTNNCPSNVHSGGFVMSFFDGHAKWSRNDSKNPTSYNCHTPTLDRLFCPSIPFVGNGYDSFCAK